MRASKLAQYDLCPGSYNAELNIPVPPESDDAESGKSVHDVIATYIRNEGKHGENYAELDEREKSVCDAFVKVWDDIRAFGVKNVQVELPCEWEEFTGTPDVTGTFLDDRHFVVDWKTGRLEVEKAQSNLQLAAYAVMRYGRYLNPVSLFLCQASNMKDPLSKGELLYGDIAERKARLKELYARCTSGFARRFTGRKQCRYCRACGRVDACPESLSMVEEMAKDDVEMSTALSMPTRAIYDLSRPPTVDEAVTIANWYSKVKLAERAIENLKEFVREVITKYPDSLPGLSLSNGKESTPITDMKVCYETGLSYGWWTDEAAFLTCCKASAPQLINLMAATVGTNKKVAKQSFIDRMKEAGCIETKTSAPSIVGG